MANALINLPKRAKKGETVEIKVLISHPMESGQRRDAMGKAIPRDIIHTFVCAWNGEEVMRAEFHPAIAANPFLSFFAVAEASGTVTMTWTDDQGATHSQSAEIVVE
ncbi:MAG: thiosulfate oxidation carrier complex protein SoxZ [Alphaproteobacteria bacterium]